MSSTNDAIKQAITHVTGILDHLNQGEDISLQEYTRVIDDLEILCEIKESKSLEEQIKMIAKVFAPDVPSIVEYCPNKPSSPQFVLDITKARKELGYNPQYTFDKLLIDFKQNMEEEPFAILWGKRGDYYE